MKTTDPYDPLSLSTLVKQRIEDKANGCRPQIKVNTHSAHGTSHSHHRSHTDEEIKHEFLGMLLDQDPEESCHLEKDQDQSTRKINSGEGTMHDFFSLNKQGVKEKNLSKEAFSFRINNSQAGNIEISGSYKNEVLALNIITEKSLSLDERKILSQIIKAKLSAELKTELEIKIDHSNKWPKCC